MKDGFIKVAAATPEIKVADCKHNAKQIISLAKELAKKDVKLAVFPELCITGYTCQDLFYQTTLLDGAKNALITILEELSELDMITVVGLPMQFESKLYNCAAVTYHGKVLGYVPKQYLPNYNEFYEMRHFTAWDGSKCEYFLNRFDTDADGECDDSLSAYFGAGLIFCCNTLHDFSFGIELCEDLWSPCPPSTYLAQEGANIILNLSASNEMIGKSEYRRSLVLNQSARLISGYIYCSAGEGESTQDLVFSGHNIIAENGATLAESELFSNDYVISEIDVNKLAFERRKNTSFRNDKCDTETIWFDIPLTDTKITRFVSRTPFIPYSADETDKRCELILSMQAHGLKKRLAHTYAKTAVIGISGGLDSTLALLVCANAMKLLGRPMTDIVAVTMPCFGTTKRTKSNAVKICEAIGVTLREIDITDSVKQHFLDIGHDINDLSVVFENGQARERTKVLMNIANQTGGLVIGTGDLSELALGWATYNGDHMSMYGVNCSIPKTLIKHLVSYYSKTTDNKLLKESLEDILDTPVSPELLPAHNGEISQKTEDLVGPYELHDFFLYNGIRWGFTPEKVFRLALYAFDGAYDRETILKWLKTFYRRFFSQQFKRSCLPDGPKVGSVTLSPRGDWRMPSDACATLWLSQIENLK